jgi:Protein of unknown function (DUF3551)
MGASNTHRLRLIGTEFPKPGFLSYMNGNVPMNFGSMRQNGAHTLAIYCALVALPLLATLASARAYEMPYDPYTWCAVYGGGPEFGGINCGFLTLEQCRATVSGVGGSCQPNQFYNPRRSQGHRRKAR